MDGLAQEGVDHEAQRLMREQFGHEKPIPPATERRQLKFQEAARLYIHNHWSLDRIASSLGIRTDSLSRIKNEDDWDGMGRAVSEVMLPSVWAAGQIMVPDISLIARESKRRADGVNDLLVEEKRIMETLPGLEIGGKAYSGAMAALNALRKLIDNATGAEYFHAEQSFGRKTLIKKAIDRDKGDDADKMKNAEGITLDV